MAKEKDISYCTRKSFYVRFHQYIRIYFLRLTFASLPLNLGLERSRRFHYLQFSNNP